jgi:hypothetical protein
MKNKVIEVSESAISQQYNSVRTSSLGILMNIVLFLLRICIVLGDPDVT